MFIYYVLAMENRQTYDKFITPRILQFNIKKACNLKYNKCFQT